MIQLKVISMKKIQYLQQQNKGSSLAQKYKSFQGKHNKDTLLLAQPFSTGRNYDETADGKTIY